MNPANAFSAALSFTLRDGIEGGYTVDQGGPTNHGVTQHQFSPYLHKKGLPDKSVAEITDAEVRDFYYTIFWRDVNLQLLAEHADPKLAIALFDTGVNTGEGRAVKMLQALLFDDEKDVDGALGEATAGAARKAIVIDRKDLVDLYLNARWSYYERLAKINTSYEKDLHGYHNRVLELESYLHTLA